MTKPFVIWTVQRTGSTSLANMLTLLSGEVVHHEPFNQDRFLSYQKEQNKLLESLEELKERQLNFKHCWNVHPNWCNDLILDFVLKENYSVILLYRQNMLKVQLSKELAKQTGIWGKKEKLQVNNVITLQPIDITTLKTAIDTYKTQLNKYRDRFENNSYSYQEVCFENLFEERSSFTEKLQYLGEICQFLAIDTNSFAQNKDKLYQQLVDNKQNDTQDYEKIPNFKKIKQEFENYAI